MATLPLVSRDSCSLLTLSTLSKLEIVKLERVERARRLHKVRLVYSNANLIVLIGDS